MDEKPETSKDMYMLPPVLGIKRSWETTNQWSEWGEDSRAALPGPTKKVCTPRSTYFQGSHIPEPPSFEEYVTLPPIRSLGFESASFAKPNPDSSTSFSGTHLLPLTNDITCSWQQFLGTSWQPQILGNQYPTDSDHGFIQQCAPQNAEEWHSFDSMDNTYITWPAPNIAPIQAPLGYNGMGLWQPSECEQQEYSFIPKEATALKLENADIIMSDNIAMGVDDINNFEAGEHTSQSDDELQSCTSPTKSPPVSHNITEGDLDASNGSSQGLSCDSCFGMIIFEKIQLRDKFFTGNAKQVSLEVNGTMVVIRDMKSNNYGGLLDRGASRVVISLFKDHNIELSAYIKTPDRIEVLIYGRIEQSNAIGDALLEQDYFLQRPDSYDPSRPYHNPQCLSGPDKEDELSWECNESFVNQTTILDEKEKSKVAELLDSATGPINFRTVQISDIIITKLKNHQTKALSMMIEKESGNIRDTKFPSVWTENPDTEPSYFRFYNTVTQNPVARTPRLCLGGLLADEMGLGKTLTILALIATSLSKRDENSHVARVTLIVCPMTTITCWQDQIERHFKKGSLIYKIYHGSTRDDDAATLKGADIILTTYETLRAGLPGEGAVIRKGMGPRRAGLLHSIDWHRIVLDEAHMVRNRSTKSFQAVNTLKAKHRWCLTGTPIQNRLDDLGALVEFLKLDPFDDPGTFRNTFLTPIDNGEQSGWERLRSLIRSIALRRTKKALDADLSLPARRETIHWIHLDDEERALYNLVKKHFTLAIDSGGSVMNTFQFILRLRQICNHGIDLLPQSLRVWLKEAASLGAAVSPLLQRCEVCDTAIDDNDSSSYHVFSCFHQICRACLQANGVPNNGTDCVCPVCDTDILEKTEGSIKPMPDHESGSMCYHPSSKVQALLQNLHNDRKVAITSGQPSAKSVVFSVWTGMLDLIGEALSKNGLMYQRLDGSKSLPQRRYALEDFRSNPNCIVLLASLGSAAVGLDLTMATRVHLMEPGWNPLLEQQAIDRVHRLGQDSEVLATRYIVDGPDSIEEYVRRRQEWKMNLIASSLDEPKTRHDEAETILKDLRRALMCV
ncbi:hypothetical protein K449DRAFT_436085 [Hypoxylon sp. EC38]|nr:hypothetical protein K449DRAFT_436085 [Hypoxylon sp. EC38]